MWEKVEKSWEKWGKVGKSGEKLEKVGEIGEKWEKRPFWIPILPKSIGTSLYSMSVATSNIKLIGAFLIKL